ncbi:hypothetical protein Nepgr_015702 [Nepenthes gracilis]|uniref:non-specific serine/threonine protein kinase n=1 Tax=Nepenthes gracilis TaxID=150966 RepID=A0AAD3XRJ2_NEPGR|nr:hypothetical protein Nepgr_015702 [Nepenthes gracilis]
MLPSRIHSSRTLNADDSMPAKVVVAIKAEKAISKAALTWALTHVVRPGDCITLLAVFPGRSTGRRLWSLPRLGGNCSSDLSDNLPDRICEISESCSQMVLQFRDQIQVRVRVKVLLGMHAGEVAAEAKRNEANWVVLDNKLKQEQKHCVEDLTCSIVVMKGPQPKVLRLNLGYTKVPQTPFLSATSSPGLDSGRLQNYKMKHATPVSSPECPSTSYSRTAGEVSFSSSDMLTSPFLVYEQNPLFEGLSKTKHPPIYHPRAALDSKSARLVYCSKESIESRSRDNCSVFWLPENHIFDNAAHYMKSQQAKSPTTEFLVDKFVQHNQDTTNKVLMGDQSHHGDFVHDPSIRDAVSIARTSSAPPPLCSLCQHKAPVFGKPPRCFTYGELEEATDGFSEMNLLAEGGFGMVHRGVLRDGQVVAVKQLKFIGSQGDADFCREVRVLSCAQHRNVVLLIGFCVDGEKRVLVYEYICNGSLDFHLHGNKTATLDLHSRLKIAIGAARGLRYLHEDCRVGCIIHRDMRPNNILLTHDFEPLVGDFGLARLHTEWDISMEQQVIGASGYLAPEYFDGGNITEKVDIYAFGVVLVELIMGQKFKESQCQKRWSSLAQLLDPLATLATKHVFADSSKSIDPSFTLNQVHNIPHEIQAMGRAACLCLHRDPESRPFMSKVLGILEGGNASIPLGLDFDSVGSRSAHMQGLSSGRRPELRKCHSRKLSH